MSTSRRTKPVRQFNSERTVLRECLKVLKDWGLAEHVTRCNTGGMYSKTGQYVAFGEAGQPDLGGVFPEWFGKAAGKRVVIEVKREGYKPPLSGLSHRTHWLLQLGQLKLVNEAGGYGFWVDDFEYLWRALDLISHGYRVVIGEDERPEFFLP